MVKSRTVIQKRCDVARRAPSSELGTSGGRSASAAMRILGGAMPLAWLDAPPLSPPAPPPPAAQHNVFSKLRPTGPLDRLPSQCTEKSILTFLTEKIYL